MTASHQDHLNISAERIASLERELAYANDVNTRVVADLRAELTETQVIAAGYLKEIERLTTSMNGHISGAERYWEGRWRDEDALVKVLTEALTEVQDMVSTEMRWMKVIREVIDAALAPQSTEPKPFNPCAHYTAHDGGRCLFDTRAWSHDAHPKRCALCPAALAPQSTEPQP